MAENKGYMTLSDEQGSIHISEEVIAAIAAGYLPAGGIRPRYP